MCFHKSPGLFLLSLPPCHATLQHTKTAHFYIKPRVFVVTIETPWHSLALVKKGLAVRGWRGLLRSCCIAWKCVALVSVISNPREARRRPHSRVSGLLSAFMRAWGTLCFPITEIWLTLPAPHKALGTPKTTKSHHYLDYITRPPTHAACPRYSNMGCLQQPDSRVVGTLRHCLGQRQQI